MLRAISTTSHRCLLCAYSKKERNEISRTAFAVWFHDELRKLPVLLRGFDRWVDVTAIRSISKRLLVQPQQSSASHLKSERCL